MTISTYGANYVRTYTHPFTAETTDFGQLEAILAENDGNLIDSLIVKGMINKADIKAAMKYAVSGELVCLNLENAEIEGDSIAVCGFMVDADGINQKKIRRIILPESVTSIGDWAFAYLPIEEINIPNSLRHIGKYAFHTNLFLNCKLIFPEGLEEIPYLAFSECPELAESPVFPSSLKRIGQQAFYITAIPELEFQEGLEKIGAMAFSGCAYLKRVVMPQSLKKIEEGGFSHDEELEEVVLPDGLAEIPKYAFWICDNLRHITVGEGCRRIGEAAFSDAGLRSIELNEGLEEIDRWAFRSTELTEVSLPSTLKWLGKDSFKSKAKWEKVWCPCAVPPECWYDENENLSDSPFGLWTALENATLYVPVGTKEAYERAMGWFQFGHIVETSEFPGCPVEVLPGTQVCGPEGSMYDLTGRRILEPCEGEIFVRDGKKYVKGHD